MLSTTLINASIKLVNFSPRVSIKEVTGASMPCNRSPAAENAVPKTSSNPSTEVVIGANTLESRFKACPICASKLLIES